jgi:hypothetical protein
MGSSQQLVLGNAAEGTISRSLRDKFAVVVLRGGSGGEDVSLSV